MKNVCCFAINISTAQLTANSLVVLSSWKKKCIGQSLTDDWSQYPVHPKWGGAGPETIDKLVSQDSDLKEEWEISLWISLFHNLNLLGLDKVFMDALDTCPPQSFQMKIYIRLCMFNSFNPFFYVPWRNLLFSPSLYALPSYISQCIRVWDISPNPLHISFHSTYTDG